MLRVGTVRQAELPVFVGLVHHGIDHLGQEILRGIIEGHQNTEGHHARKHRLPLPLRLLRAWKALGTVMLHGLMLSLLVAHLMDKALYAA